jgi:DNA-binding transcriptional LysR family regulator
VSTPRSTRRSPSSAFDSLTLEQIRLLVAVVDEGSFSAAARRFDRAQSAVSQAMATLETHVGFKVWDRSERTVKLTPRGRPLVGAARRVLAEVERMREVSEAARAGTSPKLSLAVDALFPAHGLVGLATALKDAFPGLSLRIDTDTLGAIAARVARRECDAGIAGPLATSDALERVAVGSVLLVPVAAASHPLARQTGRIATEVARDEVQIVLSERGSGADASPDQGVLGHQTWRVADLGTKRELILAGLGWGNLPEPMVREDLQRGTLVRLELAAWTDEEHRLPLALVFPPGGGRKPLVRWLLTHVPALCSTHRVGLGDP